MKNFIAVCICVFTLLGCGADETPKNTRDVAQDGAQEQAASAKQVQDAAGVALTEAQVFAYVLGREFGLPPYLNTPPRIGEMLDLDAMLQGIVDNESVLKDTTRELQISFEKQKEIEVHYQKVAEERKEAGENAKPIVLAGPIKGGNVILTETTAMIIKYSYMQGVQIDLLFDGMRRSFGEDFDYHFFIKGVRESIFSEMDPSFQKSIPDSTLKAVNNLYKKRVQKMREERRQQ